MSATDRPPDPLRMSRVELMVSKGFPDKDIVRVLSGEFDVCENTIRNDLRRLWKELEDGNEERKRVRRHVLRYQFESLHAEMRGHAEKAATGVPALDHEGQVVMVPDMRAASAMYGTCEKLLSRLCQLDGVNEETQVKTRMLRQKLFDGKDDNEIARLIAEEVRETIKTMPEGDLNALLVERERVKQEATRDAGH